jgi:hypothetical protein
MLRARNTSRFFRFAYRSKNSRQSPILPQNLLFGIFVCRSGAKAQRMIILENNGFSTSWTLR